MQDINNKKIQAAPKDDSLHSELPKKTRNWGAWLASNFRSFYSSWDGK